MTKLLALRAQLTLLRRRQRWVRWGMAYASLAIAALWALAAAFGVDYALELTRPQRAVMLVAAAGLVVWAARRFAWPWLGHRETDLDMALMVEKQQKIDSDLVAALQFETPEARTWGSTQLAGAVVDYVAEFGKSWNILEGFSRREMSRRAMLLAVTVAALALLVAVAPEYVGAFSNRFLLGSDHYPSSTIILRVLVDGREIDVRPGHDTSIKAPYGQPLTIVVETSGVRPRSGYANLRALAAGGETRVELEPNSQLPSAAGLTSGDAGAREAARSQAPQGLDERGGPSEPDAAREPAGPNQRGGASDRDGAAERAWTGERVEPGETGGGLYSGRLAKLTVSLACQLYIGDAWTDPVSFIVVPLPVVEPRFTPIPPSFARSAPIDSSAGSRQLSVVEGSQIDARLACGNKRLTEAWLTIDKVKYPLVKLAADFSATRSGSNDASGSQSARPTEIWALSAGPSGAGDTPLTRVDKPLRWEAQVVDEDGLSLEQPLEGFIRIKADQRPRVVADVVTKYVLPTAGPLIEYRATDDFGLSKLLARLEKISPDGSVLELPSRDVYDFREPVLAAHLPLKGRYRLELSPLKLVKGDQLKVVVEAVDYRGSAAGQATQSEPLVLQVTDESGVLAAISEADERSARQLDAIITRQLGIGEQK